MIVLMNDCEKLLKGDEENTGDCVRYQQVLYTWKIKNMFRILFSMPNCFHTNNIVLHKVWPDMKSCTSSQLTIYEPDVGIGSHSEQIPRGQG